MKKILSLFALLASMTASATVTVTPLSVDYNTKTVKFSVSWDGAAVNDRVWVWIDLSPITGTSPGTFAKAVISGATATAGSIETVSGNTRGFYVTHSSSTVTATLSNATSKFNWCVYGSDAPPKVTASGGTYTLHGAPPFILTAAGGAATQTVTATAIATSAVTITPVTLTDETGCPGVFCAYTGNDLLMDASHLCQLRTSSVQYWEAYIKDTRDDQVYRITQFSDDSWWMAEDLKYAGGRIGLCGTTSFYRGNNKPDCPAGWAIPTLTQVLSRNTGFADPYGASYVADKWYRPTTKTCDNIARMDQVLSDCNNTIVFLTNGKYEWNWNSSSGSGGDCSGTLHNSGRVRCFRQL